MNLQLYEWRDIDPELVKSRKYKCGFHTCYQTALVLFIDREDRNILYLCLEHELFMKMILEKKIPEGKVMKYYKCWECDFVSPLFEDFAPLNEMQYYCSSCARKYVGRLVDKENVIRYKMGKKPIQYDTEKK